MNQVWKCLFCVMAHKAALLAAARDVEAGKPAADPPPRISNAVTIIQGCAACAEHITVTDAPGSTAKAHGLYTGPGT